MINVKGNLVDENTRCTHYHSPLDIIAIKFKCCKEYYACYACHEESTDHEADKWEKNELNTNAILCGICKQEMTIESYLNCKDECPSCDSKFNPNCAKHYPLYFDVSG